MKYNTLLRNLGISIIINTGLAFICGVLVLIGLIKAQPMFVLWTYFIYKLGSSWLAGVTKRLGVRVVAATKEPDVKVSDK